MRKTLRGTAAALVAVATAATFTLSLDGAIGAKGHGAVPPPPAQPTRADQIQNIDRVKTAIKAYYGDTLTNEVDPYAGDGADVPLHTYNPDGAYAHEAGKLARRATGYLRHFAKQHKHSKRAIILDVDDTTLNTYNYEIYANFVYNPTNNAAFVNAAAFPEVPGMPRLVSKAVARGYEIFFLTGRPEAQRAGTTTNLTKEGYPTPAADHLFLKDQTLPWLSSCTPTCTSAQYKALTRQHLIEDLGFKIVANFGDQPSDFTGGFAKRTFQLPNPMYYLP